MKYLWQFSIIMVITFIAEIIKDFLPLPIPASIYGLILLFAALCCKIIKVSQIKESAYFLIEIMPIMFIPVLSTLIVGLLMWYVIGVPIAWLMGIVTGWLTALSAGSRFVLGAVIGAMIAFDNGGPVNKTAALFVNGLNADGFFIPTSAKMCAGMTSPLGIAISTVLPWSRNKFTKTEKEQALSLVILSCCYVQEGVIPFQLKDPVRLTASICVGGAITGGLCMMFGLESPAVHGGVFSVAMTSNPLLFIGLWLLGGCITGLLYSILKRPLAEGAEDEEMENPLI